MGIGGTQMQIQSYQIHNVLNVYRRQLSQGKSVRTQQTGVNALNPDPVSISSEGKSQAIMEKVADSVLKKITSVNPDAEFGEAAIKPPTPYGKDPGSATYDNQFVFNTIAKDNRLETRSIAFDDSQMLMRRLDELAKAAIGRQTE
jgi:hypothetical protein